MRDVSPHALFVAIRSTQPTDVVLQINHPRSGSNGYFDRLGFDRATGAGKDGDYDPTFDALEVWNGRNVDARSKVLEDFFALLRTRHPVTPTADTDTHSIVGQEAGYPRTYVRVADDGPRDRWDAKRTEDLVRGVKELRDVVLTNGPMLRVSAGSVPVGGVLRGRRVRITVHVESAPWVVVDHVQLLQASIRELGLQRPAVVLHEVPLPSGALGADHAFMAEVEADDAFVVVVSGTQPMTPVLSPGGDEGSILPWAMTGAVWVDADHDGDSLGRKPAPTSR